MNLFMTTKEDNNADPQGLMSKCVILIEGASLLL